MQHKVSVGKVSGLSQRDGTQLIYVQPGFGLPPSKTVPAEASRPPQPPSLAEAAPVPQVHAAPRSTKPNDAIAPPPTPPPPLTSSLPLSPPPPPPLSLLLPLPPPPPDGENLVQPGEPLSWTSYDGKSLPVFYQVGSVYDNA